MRSNSKAGVSSLCFDAKTESGADLQVPIGSFNHFELPHFIDFLNPFTYVPVTYRSPLIQQQLRFHGKKQFREAGLFAKR